jgi:hypothetical protein
MASELEPVTPTPVDDASYEPVTAAPHEGEVAVAVQPEGILVRVTRRRSTPTSNASETSQARPWT